MADVAAADGGLGIWSEAMLAADGELVHLRLRAEADARTFLDTHPQLAHITLRTEKSYCDVDAVTVTPPKHAPLPDPKRTNRLWHIDEELQLTDVGTTGLLRVGSRRTKKTQLPRQDTVLWQIVTPPCTGPPPTVSWPVLVCAPGRRALAVASGAAHLPPPRKSFANEHRLGVHSTAGTG